MPTHSFAGPRPRILTEADEVTLHKELQRRLEEIDRGEVELIPIEDVWKDIFGVDAPPTLSRRSR